MPRSTRVVLAFLVLMVGGTMSALASMPPPPHTKRLSCQDGAVYWLFAAGDGATCREVSPGIVECSDPSGTNAARGSCASGCEWARQDAGCQLATNREIIIVETGGVDLECPDGRVYHVKDDHGTCRTEHSRTAQGKAECSISDGTGSITTVSASCASGCTLSRPGTECMCEEGCDRAQGDAPGWNGGAAQSPRAAAR
ncbi:MAG: hypothetical protein D6738_06665 [Acidobacteria bacterium]|nr:MAG: hypothetical protein D6738_06665 [Acidobacteriota bacterium]